MLKKVLFLVLAAFISAVSLYYLLDDEVILMMKGMLPRLNYLYLILALLLTPCIQYFRAWRFNILIMSKNSKPDFSIYKITSLLLFFNYLLPFKAGELSFPILVKRYYGIGFIHASGILIFTRILDLLCLFSIFFITGSLLLDNGLQGFSKPVMIFTGILSTVLFVMSPVITQLVQRWGQLAIINYPRVSTVVEKFFVYAQCISTARTHTQLILLTISIWLFQALVAAFAVLSLDIFIAPTELLFASSAGSVALGLPINGVAGLGPIQAAWAYILALGGVPWSVGVVTGFIWHGILVTGSVLLAVTVSLLNTKKSTT